MRRKGTGTQKKGSHRAALPHWRSGEAESGDARVGEVDQSPRRYQLAVSLEALGTSKVKLFQTE